MTAKLVRDRIPAIIRATGEIPVTRTAGPDEYQALLRDKLVEEASEFRDSGDPEELADVLEVLHAAVRGIGVDWEQVEKLRAAKAAERGGFTGRVVLLGVTPADDYADDGLCGDCLEGRCHGGEDEDDCGCARHAASVEARGGTW